MLAVAASFLQNYTFLLWNPRRPKSPELLSAFMSLLSSHADDISRQWPKLPFIILAALDSPHRHPAVSRRTSRVTPCLQVNNESLAIFAYQNISRIAITLTSAEHSWFPGRVGMIHHLLKKAQPHFLPSSRASKLPLWQPVLRWEGPAHLWPGRGRTEQTSPVKDHLQQCLTFSLPFSWALFWVGVLPSGKPPFKSWLPPRYL